MLPRIHLVQGPGPLRPHPPARLQPPVPIQLDHGLAPQESRQHGDPVAELERPWRPRLQPVPWASGYVHAIPWTQAVSDKVNFLLAIPTSPSSSRKFNLVSETACVQGMRDISGGQWTGCRPWSPGSFQLGNRVAVLLNFLGRQTMASWIGTRWCQACGRVGRSGPVLGRDESVAAINRLLIKESQMNSLRKKSSDLCDGDGRRRRYGWFGRKAYKHATERHLLTEARQYLQRRTFATPSLFARAYTRSNPMSAAVSSDTADMLESAGVPESFGLAYSAAELQPQPMNQSPSVGHAPPSELKDLNPLLNLGGFGCKNARDRIISSKALGWARIRRQEAEQHLIKTAQRLERKETLQIWSIWRRLRLASNECNYCGRGSVRAGNPLHQCNTSPCHPAVNSSKKPPGARIWKTRQDAGNLARDPGSRLWRQID